MGCFMEIVQTLESISIFTDEDEIFVKLCEKIKENFKDCLKGRDKAIIFYNENELIQRKYFLKLVSKIYEKRAGKGANISHLCHKTIKLIYKKANSLQINIDIGVKFSKNSAIFDLSKSDENFNKYLLKSIASLRYEIFKNILKVNIDNSDKIAILDNIFDLKEHIKYIVNFHFDEAEYERFKNRINAQNSKDFARRFDMLASLLEEHFLALGCSVNDDFETVRSKYLALTKIYHPDKHLGEPPQIRQNFTDKFRQIGLAYEALKPYFREIDNFISA